MLTKSYASCQPHGEYFSIPHARERGEGKAKERGDTRAVEADAKANKRSNTRAGERGIFQRRKKGENDEGNSRANGTWGGARNCRDRVTTALSQSHAEGMLMAMAVAELRGMPLTRHWIVDYQMAGIEDRDGAAFVGRLLAIVGRYARRRGGAFAAVWVREVGRRNGAHVHIAFHWPRGWKLGHLTRRWIKAAGGTYRRKASRIRPIGGSLNCAWTSPALYRENLEVLGNYFVKGSDMAVAAELGLQRLKAGGAIIGKRCGWSENLGAAARRRDFPQ